MLRLFSYEFMKYLKDSEQDEDSLCDETIWRSYFVLHFEDYGS